jgi:hypothetical protein
MRKSLLIALLILLPAATLPKAATSPAKPAAPAPAAADFPIGSAKAPLPEREADYIRIIQDARRQFIAARSVDGRRNARMALQSAVHNFMGLSHNAQDWVGVFKDTHKNPEGTQSVEIEISPGITIGTWENADADTTYGTMFQQRSPMGKLVSSLAIGD